jgi:hypothetical protein
VTTTPAHDGPTFTNVPPGLALRISAIRLTALDDGIPPVVVHYPRVETNPFIRGSIDRWHLTVHGDGLKHDGILHPTTVVVGIGNWRRVGILVPGSKRPWDFLRAVDGHPSQAATVFAAEAWARHRESDDPWTVGEPWTYLTFPRLRLIHGETIDASTINVVVSTEPAGADWGTGPYPDAQLPEPLPATAHSALRLVHTMPPAPTL